MNGLHGPMQAKSAISPEIPIPETATTGNPVAYDCRLRVGVFASAVGAAGARAQQSGFGGGPPTSHHGPRGQSDAIAEGEIGIGRLHNFRGKGKVGSAATLDFLLE